MGGFRTPDWTKSPSELDECSSSWNYDLIFLVIQTLYSPILLTIEVLKGNVFHDMFKGCSCLLKNNGALFPFETTHLEEVSLTNTTYLNGHAAHHLLLHPRWRDARPGRFRAAKSGI